MLVEIGVYELIASGKARKGHLTASLRVDNGTVLWKSHGTNSVGLYRNIPVHTSQCSNTVACTGVGQ